jgi:hypothetical protein
MRGCHILWTLGDLDRPLCACMHRRLSNRSRLASEGWYINSLLSSLFLLFLTYIFSYFSKNNREVLVCLLCELDQNHHYKELCVFPLARTFHLDVLSVSSNQRFRVYLYQDLQTAVGCLSRSEVVWIKNRLSSDVWRRIEGAQISYTTRTCGQISVLG